MFSRISFFQKNGGMALFSHLIVNGGITFPLCFLDKQFILWTMREIVVTSNEISVTLINSSLQWLIWLLNLRLYLKFYCLFSSILFIFLF